MPFEELAAPFRQGSGVVAPVERDPFKQTLVAEVAQVTGGAPSVVAQVALDHDPKRADG